MDAGATFAEKGLGVVTLHDLPAIVGGFIFYGDWPFLRQRLPLGVIFDWADLIDFNV